jgi:alpha-mannosidase
MNVRAYVLAATLGLIPCAWADRAACGDDPAKQRTFWVIPHTHWEGAVFKTREEYLEMGLPNILKAMYLLKKQPDYRFTLDQVAYVKPFLERFPEMEVDFRKFVAEGRLQLVLGMDIMPDVNMPGGETFIRQVQYGKGYYREKLGVDVTAGWLIDTFGHHAQLPQLLKLGGYKTFWFSRGVPRPEHPSEFLWEGIDGTRIPTFWLPYSYGLLYRSPQDLPRFREFVKKRFNLLNASSWGSDRAGLSGADVSAPEEHLVPLVNEFNRQPDMPFTLRMAVPADFEVAALRRTNWPVFKGELNPIFQGTYSSRIELKERMRTMERLLTTAEKLGVLASWLGAPPDRKGLWRAWEPVLFNETHDLASGVMTDHVYEDTVRSYDFAERLVGELIQTSWDRLVAKIDTRCHGIPIVVFNTLGWPRTDVAEINVSLSSEGFAGISVIDLAGQSVPVQVVKESQHDDGRMKIVRIAFLARDVPAMGYCCYQLRPSGTATTPELAVGTPGTLENGFYKVVIDPPSGAIESLVLKEGNWEAIAGKANVVARQPDRGDLWELYQGLDGGSKIAMTRKQPVPRPGSAMLSSEFKGFDQFACVGPVYSEFGVRNPFDTGSFATRLRLYKGMRRIDIATTLINNEKFVRYQALFPTTIKSGKSFHAIPFGVIDRPMGIEFPAQDWVDYGDGTHGLALVNIGLPGNLVTDGTMMLSLLRSHTLGAYGFGGGYEPGMSSDTGLELAKERTLRYALVPHKGDWREAGIYRYGLEFNNPLICRKAAPHEGPLPKRWGFLEVSHPNIVVSAIKGGDGGTTILRVYEASGKAVSHAAVKLRTGIVSARECNLMEDPGRELTAVMDTIQFGLKPFEIKTFKVQLESAGIANSN